MRKVDKGQRRAEIAQAAADIIATRGLEGLTTRSIAKQMGCSIGVLAHYFDRKEEIVIEALNWANERIFERMAWGLAETVLHPLAGGIPVEDAWQNLKLLVEKVMPALQESECV